MSSHKHPETLQLVPTNIVEDLLKNRKEVLRNADCTVDMLTKTALDTILADQTYIVRSGDDHFFEQTKPINFEHSHNRYPVTSEKDPAIILSYGASYCSLIFAFDKDGNCVGLHQPMIPADTNPRSIEEMQRRINSFNVQADSYTNSDTRTLFLSGMNLPEGDAINARQTVLNEFVKSDLYGDANDPKIVPVWINAEQEPLKEIRQKIIGNLCLALTNLGRKLEGKDLTRIPEYINGIVFIPKYLSSDGLNHILLVDGNDATKILQDKLFVFGE